MTTSEWLGTSIGTTIERKRCNEIYNYQEHFRHEWSIIHILQAYAVKCGNIIT